MKLDHPLSSHTEFHSADDVLVTTIEELFNNNIRDNSKEYKLETVT